MYFIFRYAHHVLDIEVIVISVSYGAQYIISLIYCRVQLVSRLAGVCQRLRVLKIQGRGRELMIGVDSCWKVADDESNIYPNLPDPQSRRVPFTDYGWYMRRGDSRQLEAAEEAAWTSPSICIIVAGAGAGA
jgi:hypothetical protein